MQYVNRRFYQFSNKDSFKIKACCSQHFFCDVWICFYTLIIFFEQPRFSSNVVLLLSQLRDVNRVATKALNYQMKLNDRSRTI